jgi:hypothetical protein
MKIVINKCFGGFGLSVEALYKSVKDNNSLIEKFEYGDSEVTSDWDNLVNQQLNETYKEYKTDDYQFYLYDEETKILYTFAILDRGNPQLVALVEGMGELANGQHAKLKIVEIPDDIAYFIDEYDGRESVHEDHRIWS